MDKDREVDDPGIRTVEKNEEANNSCIEKAKKDRGADNPGINIADRDKEVDTLIISTAIVDKRVDNSSTSTVDIDANKEAEDIGTRTTNIVGFDKFVWFYFFYLM